jgi:farnesyl diphosphate synthase
MGQYNKSLTGVFYDRYRKIVINKTAYYTFYLSVACAMLLSGVVDDASHNLAKKICIEIGEYFQIQDDYLDCYGDEKIIGKVYFLTT